MGPQRARSGRVTKMFRLKYYVILGVPAGVVMFQSVVQTITALTH